MSSAPSSTVSGQAPRAGTRDWIALGVLMLPVLLVSVDNTVLSFAIPKITADLTPTGSESLWMIDIYPLVLAGLLISMGSFADRIGRRRMLLIGGTGFTVVSALAAFAPSAFWLIVARAVLGLFGAMIMPATLSLIRNTFLDSSQRRKAVAIWASCFAGGSALGPIVGGLLLENFPWGSVFLMAVPVLIPLLVLGPILITESRDPNPGRIDPTSIVLSFAAMVPIVLSIKTFSAEGASPKALIAAAVGALCLWLFVRRQLRHSNPMLDVRLFGIRTFTGSALANMLSLLSMTGFLFFVAQHLQLIVGMSPTQSGLVLLPGMAMSVIIGLTVARLARIIPPAWLVSGGLLLNAIGYAAMAFINPPPVLLLMLAFMLVGAGVGAAETLSNDLILSSAPPEKAAAAASISETAYEIGAILGTAILGSVLTAVYRSQLVLPEGLDPTQIQHAQGTLAGALETAKDLPGATADALWQSASHAFDNGAVVTSLVACGLMLGAATLAAFMLRGARIS